MTPLQNNAQSIPSYLPQKSKYTDSCFFFLCWKADRTYTIHHETKNNKKKSTIPSFCYLRLAPTRLINHHWYSDSFAEEIFLNKHLR